MAVTLYVDGDQLVTVEHLHGDWFLVEHLDGTFSMAHARDIRVVLA